VSKLLAPYTPFLAEEIYRNLVAERYPDEPESVHLCDWPEADLSLIDEDLSFRMGVARKVVNLGRAARAASQLKTRQPLAVAVVACNERERSAIESLADVVKEEINVKALEYVDSAVELVSHEVKPNYRTLGPRFGKVMPEVAALVAALPGEQVVRLLAAGEPVKVSLADRDEELSAEDLLVETTQREGLVVDREGDLVVGLSTALTKELAQEGLARELVHHVQNTRKAAGFRVEDRILLTVDGPEEVLETLDVHREWVAKETLSVSLMVGSTEPLGGEAYQDELVVNGLPVTVTVVRAEGAAAPRPGGTSSGDRGPAGPV
jgi:isoleucyl-tRNA synthetase